MLEEISGRGLWKDTIKTLLLELSKLILKKCYYRCEGDNNTFGFMGYDAESGDFFEGYTEEIPYRSHGTGDVFASTFTGAFLNDYSTQDALMLAAEFTCRSIKDTLDDPDKRSYAINFESQLPYLINKLGRG